MQYTIDFWRSDGSFWSLSVSTPAGVLTGDRIAGTLAPGGTTVVNTTGQGALTQGWAELTYDFNRGAVAGFAVFRQSIAGRPDFEAVVPATSLFNLGDSIVLPYDNSAGFSTGVACVNGAGSGSATVTATFRDEAGATYATESFLLPPSGHLSFSMPARYPATQGRRGTVVFRSNLTIPGSTTKVLSVMGLRFNPTGAFTTLNAYDTFRP